MPSSETSKLTLEQDGTISGHGGCNGFGGNARIDGSSIRFDNLFSTMMACEQAVLDQEYAFHMALENTASYAFVDGASFCKTKQETKRPGWCAWNSFEVGRCDGQFYRPVSSRWAHSWACQGAR